MVRKCIVFNCPSNDKSVNTTFHRLGKKRYNEWLPAIGRNPMENLSEMNTICSRHFKESDFNTTGQRVVIKNDAMPTINLPRISTFFNQNLMKGQPLDERASTSDGLSVGSALYIKANKVLGTQSYYLLFPPGGRKPTENIGSKNIYSNQFQNRNNVMRDPCVTINNNVVSTLNRPSFATKSPYNNISNSDEDENGLDPFNIQDSVDFIKAIHNYSISPQQLKLRLVNVRRQNKMLQYANHVMTHKNNRLKMKMKKLKSSIVALQGFKRKRSKPSTPPESPEESFILTEEMSNQTKQRKLVWQTLKFNLLS